MTTVKTYSGGRRAVSPMAYKLLNKTGAPSFAGEYGKLMEKYDNGEITRSELIAATLVEMINEYSTD